jgi:hypothetical protein
MSTIKADEVKKEGSIEFPQFYLKGGSHHEEHSAAFGRNHDSSRHREVQEFNRGLRGLRGLILTTNEYG